MNEEQLVAGEELARHPELQPCELVNGRVVPQTLAEFGHGNLALEIGARRWSELSRKAQEYLAAGALRVWLVHPRKREVTVHRTGGQPETLGLGDTLRDEEILPGLFLPLAELFQD